MKLRYYMRGLGIGVLVTAILMSITLHGKTEPLSDEEIIARAKELGMTEKYETTVLSDTVTDEKVAKIDDENPEEADKDSEAIDKNLQEPNKEPEVADNAEQTNITETVSENTSEILTDSEQAVSTKGEEEHNQSDAMTQEKIVQITVQGGDGSLTVARKLKEAGLIEDAAAYDKYLCSNGYDKRICTGTHSFTSGASQEEIAKIITTRSR